MAAIRETTYARQRLIGLLEKAESVLKHLGPGDHPSGSPQEVHAGMGGGNWNMSLEELRFAGLHLPVDDTVITRWLGSRSDLKGLEDYPYDASSGDQPETLEELRKKQVMEKLAAKLKDNPDFQAYVKIRIEQIVPFSDDPTEAVVANMVHAWAESSGDHNPQSLYIQQAIVDEFGLLDEVSVTGHLTADMQKWYSRDAGAYRAFVRAQYDLTQVELARHGITELVLFRGMNWGSEFDWTERGYNKGGWMDLEQQPISSYSWNYRVANDFAMSDRFRAIIAVKVPASSIFSTPLTGLGSLVEYEVVVMNNPDMRGLVRGTTFGGSSTVLDFLRFAEIQGGLKSKRLKINVDSPQHNADWIPTLAKLRIAGIIPMKGGRGSGFAGHAGRAGLVGGSSRGSSSGIRGGKLLLEKRVWQGKQQGSLTARTRLDRQAVGAQGEVIAKAVMEKLRGEEFDSLSKVVANSPLDLLGDTSAVEVKTGAVGNAPKSQHWRITLGQMGQEESGLVRKMTPLQRKFYYKSKMKYIGMRKVAMMKKLGRFLNRKFNPFTMGIIMSPSGRADVFLIPGFHERLSWRQYAIDKYYVGTYSMGQISENTGY